MYQYTPSQGMSVHSFLSLSKLEHLNVRCLYCHTTPHLELIFISTVAGEGLDSSLMFLEGFTNESIWPGKS